MTTYRKLIRATTLIVGSAAVLWLLLPEPDNESPPPQGLEVPPTASEQWGSSGAVGRCLEPEPRPEAAADPPSAIAPALWRAEATTGSREVSLVLTGCPDEELSRADVLVRYDATDEDWERFEDLDSIDRFMEETGVLLHPARGGEVSLRIAPETLTLVLGRTETTWGVLVLDGEEESPTELELRRDRTVRVQVVDGHGDPLSGVSLRLEEVEHDRRSWLIKELTRSPAGIALFRHLQEYLGESDEAEVGVAGDVEVSLHRGLAVRVTVETTGAIPDGYRLELALSSPGEEIGELEWDSAVALDSEGKALVFAESPGRARLDWFVERRTGLRTTVTRAALPSPVFVELQEVEGTQDVRISLSPDDLNRLLAALQ